MAKHVTSLDVKVIEQCEGNRDLCRGGIRIQAAPLVDLDTSEPKPGSIVGENETILGESAKNTFPGEGAGREPVQDQQG